MKINSLPIRQGSSKIPTEKRGEEGKLLQSQDNTVQIYGTLVTNFCISIYNYFTLHGKVFCMVLKLLSTGMPSHSHLEDKLSSPNRKLRLK